MVAALLGMLVPLPMAAATAESQIVAGRNAIQWLELMDRALAETNYDGMFTYVHGNEVSSLRVVHGMLDGQSVERLIHLDGVPRLPEVRGVNDEAQPPRVHLLGCEFRQFTGRG